jgi:hypothetical protein
VVVFFVKGSFGLVLGVAWLSLLSKKSKESVWLGVVVGERKSD